MKAVYQLSVWAYRLGIGLAAPFNAKAAAWLKGRSNWQSRLPQAKTKTRYWFHCASLGEFEQARPLIDHIEICLSFFSPSGYEQKKDWPIASWVGYLPIDSHQNAQTLLDALQPDKVFFVKYEFWYAYLKEVNKRHIPLFLISARLRKEQPFFKWYGTVYREMLGFYSHIFTQDQASVDLLKGIGVQHVTYAGDTRFDRVLDLKQAKSENPLLAEFCGEKTCLVAGSSWPVEEELLAKALKRFPEMCWIIVPHDVSEQHIVAIEKQFEGDVMRYSSLEKGIRKEACSVLIIDRIGLLGNAYSYGDLALVGGGFTNALHNILEAAVWGIPVLYGNNTPKYPEGEALASYGGGIRLANQSDFEQALLALEDTTSRMEMGEKAAQWIEENAGATKRILGGI